MAVLACMPTPPTTRGCSGDQLSAHFADVSRGGSDKRRNRAHTAQAALEMFDALGCSGVARIDFFLTEDGPVLNEVNTMPGMTAESQVPRMFAAAGVPYDDLVARLAVAASVRETTDWGSPSAVFGTGLGSSALRRGSRPPARECDARAPVARR